VKMIFVFQSLCEQKISIMMKVNQTMMTNFMIMMMTVTTTMTTTTTTKTTKMMMMVVTKTMIFRMTVVTKGSIIYIKSFKMAVMKRQTVN
jgi:hypothetical protein